MGRLLSVLKDKKRVEGISLELSSSKGEERPMENKKNSSKEQFFAHLDNLTVLELVDYIKEFETRYGISAAMAPRS